MIARGSARELRAPMRLRLLNQAANTSPEYVDLNARMDLEIQQL
jgi:hypothetical protein